MAQTAYFNLSIPAPHRLAMMRSDGAWRNVRSWGLANALHAYAAPEFSGMGTGDYLRKMARDRFGRSIANRWFN